MIVGFSVAQLTAEHSTVILNMEKEPCLHTVNIYSYPISATAESDLLLIGQTNCQSIR